MKDGAKLADRAFERALKIDAKLKDRIDAIKADPGNPEAGKKDLPDALKPVPWKPGEHPSSDEKPDRSAKSDKSGSGAKSAWQSGSASDTGPQMVGKTDEQAWGKLSDKEQA